MFSTVVPWSFPTDVDPSLCESLADGDYRDAAPCLYRRVREDVFISGILSFLPDADVIHVVSFVNRAYRGAVIQSDAWQHVVEKLPLESLAAATEGGGPWLRAVEMAAPKLLARWFDVALPAERRMLTVCVDACDTGEFLPPAAGIRVYNPCRDRALYRCVAARFRVDVIGNARAERGTMKRVYTWTLVFLVLSLIVVSAAWAAGIGAIAAGATPLLLPPLVALFAFPAAAGKDDVHVPYWSNFVWRIFAGALSLSSLCGVVLFMGIFFVLGGVNGSIVAMVLSQLASASIITVCLLIVRGCVGFSRASLLRAFHASACVLSVSAGCGLGLAWGHGAPNAAGLTIVSVTTAVCGALAVIPLGVEAHSVSTAGPIFGSGWTPKAFKLTFAAALVLQVAAAALGVLFSHFAIGFTLAGSVGASATLVVVSGPLLALLGVEAKRLRCVEPWDVPSSSSGLPL